MHINGKDIYFVAIPNRGKKKIDWHTLTESGEVFMDSACNNYSEWERCAACTKPAMSYNTMSSNILAIREAARKSNLPIPSFADAYTRIVSDFVLYVPSDPIIYLNSDLMIPRTVLVINPLTNLPVLAEYHDTIIRYDKSVVREDKIIQGFYDQIENGDYLLYYLNEFRNNRPIPAILTAGFGGAGKSTVGVHYTAYKQPCLDYFSGDISTDNFGKTSLVLCEEADMKNTAALTLNKVKNTVTSKWHRVRRLYTDGITAKGFVTLFFSANNNDQSLILQLYNHKGEDTNSIRRRTSTFNFTEQNHLYIKDNGIGEYLVETAVRIPDGSSLRTVPIDAHLNYLETTGFFNQPKFVRGDHQFILVHSPSVEVGTRLYARDAAILESLYELCKDANDGDKLNMLETGDLMKALKAERGAMGVVKIGKSVEHVAPGACGVSRSNNQTYVHIKKKSIIIDAYMAHIKDTNVI